MTPERRPDVLPTHVGMWVRTRVLAGAEWIDGITAAARVVRDEPIGREVVGHGDWVANHVRFDGEEPCVA
jgi:hypothetical protein